MMHHLDRGSAFTSPSELQLGSSGSRTGLSHCRPQQQAGSRLASWLLLIAVWISVPNMASDDGLSDYQSNLIYAGVILGLTALLIYALIKALTYLIDSIQDELAYVK